MENYNKQVEAVVLAAGKSSRFNTNQSKLLEKICGQEMILYVTKTLENLEIKTSLVLGYQKDRIEDLITQIHCDNISFVEQKIQNGTGHAVKVTLSELNKDHILVLNGDIPLINEELIDKLVKQHLNNKNSLTFVAAYNFDPTVTGYGTVVKDNGKIKIVEAKEWKHDPEISEHSLLNAGLYIFERNFLTNGLEKLQKSSITGEIYITDLIEIANNENKNLELFIAPFDKIRGVNTLQELWAVEQIKKSELIKSWMNRGVRFASTQNINLDIDVTIGSGSYIGSGVEINKGTSIGNNCKIESYSVIKQSIIEDNVTIKNHTIIDSSQIKRNAKVGPFAHIHGQSIVDNESIMGNFVECKRTSIGKNSTIKHLSYFGDAHVGNNVKVGAGTITCNYDGASKHRTIIEDHVLIGSNNSLVAPVIIGEGAYTAAGSTITVNVPPFALSIARSRQINKHERAFSTPMAFTLKKIFKSI